MSGISCCAASAASVWISSSVRTLPVGLVGRDTQIIDSYIGPCTAIDKNCRIKGCPTTDEYCPGAERPRVFLMGVGTTALLLFYEHWLLRAGDLTKLDMAFFNMNGYISINIFIFTLIDVLAG